MHAAMCKCIIAITCTAVSTTQLELEFHSLSQDVQGSESTWVQQEY